MLLDSTGSMAKAARGGLVDARLMVGARLTGQIVLRPAADEEKPEPCAT